MAVELTLSIIKPNAVKKNVIGEIEHRIEQAGLKIIAMKMVKLTKEQAAGFYAEHKDKPFFGELIDFITSEAVVVQVLEGENAIFRYRELMGATDPQKAASGTLRADYADSQRANAVHGSDSKESAQREINYFFTENEIYYR